MPKPVRANQRVAFFEDGVLWHDEEASPPESPAGWYFRPRGSSEVWIGPFPTADAASVAPSRGDPLAAARRHLEEWARSRAEPELVGSGASDACVRPGHDEPSQPVCVPASPLLGEPEQAADGLEQVPAGALRPSEVASMARQLTLDLGPAPQIAVEDGTRRPPRRRRRAARGELPATMQEVFTLDAVPTADEA
jgi:hypothetical protein